MIRVVPRAAGALASASLVALAIAPAASAHARLEAVSPPGGALAERPPSLVVFRFGEPVEGRLGSVRVVDSRGRRIDDGRVLHPGGRSTLGARVVPDAAKGTYTATYRLVSEDGHVVMGGSSFSVGHRSAPSAAARMQGMPGPPRAGPVTKTAFGLARGFTYLATALVVGLLAFLRFVWLPALDATAGGATFWTEASDAFGTRVRRLLYAGIQVGVIAGIAGIALEGPPLPGARSGRRSTTTCSVTSRRRPSAATGPFASSPS